MPQRYTVAITAKLDLVTERKYDARYETCEKANGLLAE